ncbi:MAG: NAD(P)/FAD-dependent oxidoreductase, partial [Myxococcota bacterium]|nr:NAD(P)/FAD-dependent oxidoreductase [Myxococcota bacterium]
MDLAVIGAGVVGCAVTSLAASLGQRVVLLEAESREGTGLTSRNSGVLHSGVHHPSDWLKTRLCVRGRALLVPWLETHGVPHALTGKLIVATASAQVGRLEAIAERASDNGADVRRVTKREARALEPALGPCVEALWCPQTGIVDSHALTRSLRGVAERHGADVVFDAGVTAVAEEAAGWRLLTTRGPLVASRVVNAAGLGAHRVAQLFGAAVPDLYFCRGDYFHLTTPKAYTRLVYPVREPNAPGLGVHLTLDLGGRVRLGPDTEWVSDGWDVGPAERPQAKLDAFHLAGQSLLGAFSRECLRWDGCGVRPKLSGPGQPDADFCVLRGEGGDTHLLGIESPGLTACLALAEMVL